MVFIFRSGDSAVNIAGDQVEPVVTLCSLGSTNSRSSRESRGFNLLSCIGNRVVVLDGDAKGAEGRVIGKHGGAEHVMVDFSDDEVFDKLQIGDIIAIIDAEHTYGRIYRTGAVSIGVIAHSDSKIAGHGPGVTTIFTSATGNIELVIDPNANLAKLLKIR